MKDKTSTIQSDKGRDSGKMSTSVSLDRELVDIIDDTADMKRSTLLNKLGWEWARSNGYAE